MKRWIVGAVLAAMTASGCTTAGRPRLGGHQLTCGRTAIARPDNDFSPSGDRKGRSVKAPPVVAEKVDGIAVANRLDVTSDAVCGPTYAVSAPDGRILYVFSSIEGKDAEFHYYLMLHDPRTNELTADPPAISGTLTHQEPDLAPVVLAKPFVRFVDIDEDGRLEIAFPEVRRHHSGGLAVLTHYFDVGDGGLWLELSLETRRRATVGGREGWIVRDVPPNSGNRLSAGVSFLPENGGDPTRLGGMTFARGRSGMRYVPVSQNAMSAEWDSLIGFTGQPAFSRRETGRATPAGAGRTTTASRTTRSGSARSGRTRGRATASARSTRGAKGRATARPTSKGRTARRSTARASAPKASPGRTRRASSTAGSSSARTAKASPAPKRSATVKKKTAR